MAQVLSAASGTASRTLCRVPSRRSSRRADGKRQTRCCSVSRHRGWPTRLQVSLNATPAQAAPQQTRPQMIAWEEPSHRGCFGKCFPEESLLHTGALPGPAPGPQSSLLHLEDSCACSIGLTGLPAQTSLCPPPPPAPPPALSTLPRAFRPLSQPEEADVVGADPWHGAGTTKVVRAWRSPEWRACASYQKRPGAEASLVVSKEQGPSQQRSKQAHLHAKERARQQRVGGQLSQWHHGQALQSHTMRRSHGRPHIVVPFIRNTQNRQIYSQEENERLLGAG